RVDRHVEQRIGPGEPAVPETPEAAERPLDPLVVATLDGQHRGQLADEQRFGNTVDEWRRDQQQQRDAGAHRAHQPFQAERPAGATAALTLARRGLSVALLERDALPRYKTCGGGLVGRALALLPPEVERVLERRCGQADLHLLDVNQHYRATRDPPSAPIVAT